MKSASSNNPIKTLFYWMGGLVGINLIILIHEMGHFLFAKLFDIPTPYFSLGFGPAIIAYPIGQTTFILSLLPFGGYVEMDSQALAQLSYIPQMLIISAGILFNLIFAYIILVYYTIRNQNSSTEPQPGNERSSVKATFQNMRSAISNIIKNNRTDGQNGIIGPIGIVALIGKSLAFNPQQYWFILAILSLNVGLFNILPLPFFDGGQALIFTIEAITGKTIPATLLWIISTTVLAFFILFITKISINDIKQLLKK